MAAIETAKPIPWWKEPTKDQWLAWSAAWLGWTLDAFDFTIFLLIMLPISQEFDVPLTAVTAVFTLTLWMRLVGATRVRLARRPDRAQETADDLDRLVLGLQFHRRLFSNLLVSISLSRVARHRYGRGMAVRRGARDGNLADPLARLYGRRAAGLVGPWRPAVERGLRPAV